MIRTHIRTLAIASLVSVSLIAAAFVLPHAARAQEAPDVVSCFDYYSFGSIQANIQSSVTGTVSGAPITFTGEVVNNNDYPVVDGALYVKVFRLQDDPAEKSVDGPNVVDQFFVRDGIALPAHGSLPVAFSWDVPSYAQSGEYEVATYFTSAKKFNLLGLSFTDDVVGNTVNFTVSGEREDSVYFDKSGVTINGEPYHFAAFPPRMDAGSSVHIEATITNETDQAVQIPVTWRLYQWDAQRLENKVDEKTITVSVPAHGTAPAIFETTDSAYPVYLAVGTMQWRNTESDVNIRFVRMGVDRLRINFPALTAFPLKDGEATTMFSCLYNSGESDLVSDGRLDVELTDDSGNVIYGYTYTGDVSGDMMGVARTFTPDRSYNRVHLSARLYQGNTLVDDATLTYDCRDIDAGACLPDGDAAFRASFGGGALGLVLTAIAALLVLAGAAWIGMRVLGSHKPDAAPEAPEMPSSTGAGL